MNVVRKGIAALLFLVLIAAIALQLSPGLKPWPIAQSAASSHPGPVTVTYLGTTTLLVSDGKTALLTDGYFSRVSMAQLFTDIAPNRERITRALAQAGIDHLDAIPVLHSHFDHAMDSGTVAQMTGAQLLGSASTAMAGRGSGLANDRITTVETHHPYHFGDFTLYFVPAAHVPLPRLVERLTGKGEISKPLRPPAPVNAWQLGRCYALVIEHPSGRLLIQGSAGMQAGELDRYQADYAFLASASLGKQSEAYQQAFMEETAQAVGAHTVIPVHWDDFFRELSPQVRPLPWLMDNLDRSFEAMASRHQGDFLVLKPFQSLLLVPPAAADRATSLPGSSPALPAQAKARPGASAAADN